MNLHLDHADVNPKWKWLVIHDDINVHMDRNRYRYITQLCGVFFGPEDSFTVTGVWTAGKMGWKFQHHIHALEFMQMISVMDTTGR